MYDCIDFLRLQKKIKELRLWFWEGDRDACFSSFNECIYGIVGFFCCCSLPSFTVFEGSYISLATLYMLRHFWHLRLEMFTTQVSFCTTLNVCLLNSI